MKTTLIIIIVLFYSVSELRAQEKNIVVESIRNDDKSVSFNYSKQPYGTYHLCMWFTRLENARTTRYSRNITGKSGNLMTLKPNNKESHINYSYKYWYIRGKLKPKIDPEFAYLLPLSTQKKFKTNQLSNLNAKYFGAKKPKNWNAYLFYAEVGDTVYAARKGTIVQITDEHNYLTELSVSYQSKINHVLVEHPDGTLSSYKGFQKDQIFLKEGDKVYPRTPIGTLAQYDNSGLAQLRFSVYYLDLVTPQEKSTQHVKDKIQHYAYILPKFFTDKGLEYLKAGETYKAVEDWDIIVQEFTRKELKKLRKK